MIVGAGNIGTLIACMLSESKQYRVYLSDLSMQHFDRHKLGTETQHITLLQCNVENKGEVINLIKQNSIEAIVSCLPYYANYAVALIAKEQKIHYFDLTEDVSHTEKVIELALGASSAFVPQCGLAPGFISIVAHEYMQGFDTVDSVLMRVGSLPLYPNNALKYALTWSTDGLINEYGNTCFGLQDGKMVTLQPLEGQETVQIDGLLYEAFNTSGGLGTLANTYEGQVQTMNYKTLRYPGHCEKFQFLMNDLKLNNRRDVLKNILEQAIPKTTQDVVLIYVYVNGQKNNQYIEKTYVKKIYPKEFVGRTWSSIQISTASGLCSVFDLVMHQPQHYQGLISQQRFKLADITQSHFGKCYAN